MHAIRHALLLLALAQPGFRVYHEAWCPTVDQARMTRVKRVAAVEEGQIPAADCHPDGPVRYLGELPFGEGAAKSVYARSTTSVAADDDERPKTVHVDAHMRNGRPVQEHMRAAPRR